MTFYKMITLGYYKYKDDYKVLVPYHYYKGITLCIAITKSFARKALFSLQACPSSIKKV